MTRVVSLVLLCGLLVLAGPSCRRGPRSVQADADFDPAEARAEADRPSSTVVEYVSIPADPALPKWVVVVEPFQVAASGITSGTSWYPMTPPGTIGPGIASQLLSALSRVGNVVVIDHETYQRDPEKMANHLQPDEQGPFLIKGTVTEFSETAELFASGDASSGSQAGNVVSGVGGVVPYGGVIGSAGRLISQAKGNKERTETRRKGMVAMDIQIINPATGRMLGSFVADGTFVAVEVTRAKSKFGSVHSSSDYASSAIGQAQRVALNNAIQQIHGILSQAPSGR